MLRFFDKPVIQDLEKLILGKDAVVLASDDFQSGSVMLFRNYADAQEAARCISYYGDSVAGAVWQGFHDKTDATLVGQKLYRLKAGDRPEQTSPGKFSLFHVPIHMDHTDFVRLMPTLAGRPGKVIQDTSPDEQRAALLKLGGAQQMTIS